MDDAGRPLHGRTVVVTRAGERAADLTDALERAGATVLSMPLTRQVEAADGGAALAAAAVTVRENRWVVLTSVNAVDAFMAVLRDARALADVSVAAVGPVTADALRGAGIEPDLIPAAPSAHGLIDAFPDAAGEGSRRVLFPCGDLAPDLIPGRLGQKGWEVERVEAYRTVPRHPPDAALLERVSAADAVTFTAGSAVRAFVALRGASGEPLTPPGHIVCIGTTTAEAARAAGLRGVREASMASAQGIVDEVIAAVGSDGGDAPVGCSDGRGDVCAHSGRVSHAPPAPPAPHTGAPSAGGRGPPRRGRSGRPAVRAGRNRRADADRVHAR